MSGKGHHIVMPATYIKVLVALMVLMFLTIYVAKSETFNFGEPWNVILALVIAFAKMALIMSFFMHVKFASPITRAFALAGLFWIGLLFILTFNDYATRGGWHTDEQFGWHSQFAHDPYDHEGLVKLQQGKEAKAEAPAAAPAPAASH